MAQGPPQPGAPIDILSFKSTIFSSREQLWGLLIDTDGSGAPRPSPALTDKKMINAYFSHIPVGSEISPGYQISGPTSPLHSEPSELLFGARHFYVIFNDTRHAGT